MNCIRTHPDIHYNNEFLVTSYTTKNIKILNKKKMKTKPDSDNDTILYKDSSRKK